MGYKGLWVLGADHIKLESSSMRSITTSGDDPSWTLSVRMLVDVNIYIWRSA
jgi:hypothetical protein